MESNCKGYFVQRVRSSLLLRGICKITTNKEDDEQTRVVVYMGEYMSSNHQPSENGIFERARFNLIEIENDLRWKGIYETTSS